VNTELNTEDLNTEDLNTEDVQSKKKRTKVFPWLLYAVTMVGCGYLLLYVFPRLSHFEQEDHVVTASAPAVSASRPCLELTSDQGTARDGFSRIAGWVRNNCEKRFNYVEVEYKLYDAGGDVVGGAMTNLAALGPYESWKFEAIAMQPYKRYQLAHIAADDASGAR
jgi:hypothetical protein